MNFMHKKMSYMPIEVRVKHFYMRDFFMSIAKKIKKNRLFYLTIKSSYFSYLTINRLTIALLCFLSSRKRIIFAASAPGCFKVQKH